MEQQPTLTFRRSPFEIVGECISIYGRHFRKLILIALIIQIPLSAFELVVANNLPTVEDLQALVISATGDPQAALSDETETVEPLESGEITRLAAWTTAFLLVTIVLTTFLGSVFSYAIGIQYAAGRMDVVRCYGRAWWRVLTLITLGLLFFGLFVLILTGLTLLIVPGIVMMVLLIYFSTSVTAVAIEGNKPIVAMRRSFELVRGNWWRTFTTWVLMLLLVFGLTILLTLPISLLALIDFSETVMRVASTVWGTMTNVIILPIPGITGALIYLDLRARKEDYDVHALSEQLGISPPNGYDMDTETE